MKTKKEIPLSRLFGLSEKDFNIVIKTMKRIRNIIHSEHSYLLKMKKRGRNE